MKIFFTFLIGGCLFALAYVFYDCAVCAPDHIHHSKYVLIGTSPGGCRTYQIQHYNKCDHLVGELYTTECKGSVNWDEPHGKSSRRVTVETK